MELHLPHFGHKADSLKDELAASQPAEVEESPMTDEGITQSEVNKSEAFVSPLESEAAKSESTEAVINAEPVSAAAAAEDKPLDNVIELPTPEVTEPTAPEEQNDIDSQLPAQSA